MDKHFETHKAKLIFAKDGLYLIDFRREDGRREYYVRFFVDTNTSMVHIEGDLGYCISEWGNENTLLDISNFMLNVPYWIGKFCCSSDKYEFDEELARIQLEEDSEELKSMEDYSDNINSIMETFDINYGLMINTNDSQEAVEALFGDLCSCEIGYYGRKIAKRCYLWAEAFDLALKQLGVKKN